MTMSSITNYKHKNMNLTSIFRICKTSKEELLKPETSLSVRQRCFGTLHVKVEVRRREASDCVDELGVDESSLAFAGSDSFETRFETEIKVSF
jgi:hypothetical protein